MDVNLPDHSNLKIANIPQKKLSNMNEYISTFEIGSTERLQAIYFYGKGKRSESAKKALNNRLRRIELMEKGLTFEDSVLIVNNEKL